jgi:hypothetical protein
MTKVINTGDIHHVVEKDGCDLCYACGVKLERKVQNYRGSLAGKGLQFE